MGIKEVLNSITVLPSAEELGQLQKETKHFIFALKEAVKKEKLKAEVFVGGSFAKGTIVKKEVYDIDIFVRFDWRYDDLTALLARIIKRAVSKKASIKRLHGSRDYFQIKNNNLIFEVIPVERIKKPKEARNVTDLSYFHVSYVKRKLKSKPSISKEIALAKTFCRAQGCYGAESYINGFSGYGLECLLIHYKSFEKMARALAHAGERTILDPEKYYKHKEDVLFSINESKLHSPIILVDPTWKERNVLAALSHETFHKFQHSLQDFLKKPSPSFFTLKAFSATELKKIAQQQKAELAHINITTNRQAGDIAGTKLKKFAHFLAKELSPYFSVIREDFVYNEQQGADVYLVLKSKIYVTKKGPPIIMKKHALAFKKQNKNVFIKDGILYSKVKVNSSARSYLENWKKQNKSRLEQMEITKFDVKA